MSETTRGFLLGKFLPPHAGHQVLCDVARASCEELTILVCSLDREPIPGALRHEWMRELYPDCRVLHLQRDIPQEPSEHPQFWDIWRDIVREFHPERIDLVFASEAYGKRLAEEVGARFVPVDPGRLAAPISGTAIRANPAANWKFLPPPVRAHLARRVCLFGPESTGKTTMTARLADHFATVAAPEYGRTYTEVFGVDCQTADLVRIAEGQQAMIEAMARWSGPIMFTDTDAVLTAVWSDMLIGARDVWFDRRLTLCDFYFLMDVDSPWIDDGTRYFPDPEVRTRFFDLCRQELERREAPYVILSGPFEDRFEAAVSAVRKAFPAETGFMD